MLVSFAPILMVFVGIALTCPSLNLIIVYRKWKCPWTGI